MIWAIMLWIGAAQAGFSDAGDFTPVGGVTVYPFEPVRAILASRCSACHGPIAHEKGVDLSTYKKVRKLVHAGHPETSKLYQVVAIRIMPPTHFSPDLTHEELNTINDWIMHGAHK